MRNIKKEFIPFVKYLWETIYVIFINYIGLLNSNLYENLNGEIYLQCAVKNDKFFTKT